MKTIEIPIDQIKIKKGRRVFKEDVSDLKDSISEIGLINPITVDEKYILIAGWRRLKALKALRWKKVSVCVSTLNDLRNRLAEIDENLLRSDIPVLMRGDLLNERQDIYWELYPQTKPGGDRRSEEAKSDAQDTHLKKQPTFTEDAAKRTGKHRATIDREKAIGKNLTEPVKEAIHAATPKDAPFHPLANNKKKLEAISRLKPEAQLKKVRAELSGSSKTSSAPEDYNEADEWYTPGWVIESAKEVMGVIDLDPASSPTANKVVKAKKYYTVKDNGLELEWNGKIFLNPPFSKYTPFIDGLLTEVAADRCTEAILVVNNSTETGWFQKLLKKGYLICFPKGRLDFYNPDRESLTGRNGQAIFYIGEHEEEFTKVFSRSGIVVRRVK